LTTTNRQANVWYAIHCLTGIAMIAIMISARLIFKITSKRIFAWND